MVAELQDGENNNPNLSVFIARFLTSTAMKPEVCKVNDLIRQVVSIHGKLIDFLGIIYLENGNSPKAMLFTRVSSEQGLLAFQSSPNLENLTSNVRRVAEKLAILYDCKVDIRSVADLIESHSYEPLLLEMQGQWAWHKNRQRTMSFLN